MIYFHDKIFLFALAALPLLAVIYFLFRRSRPRIVSSLMFWEDQLKSRQSGLKIKRLPLPLTFLLELLAIILLVLAAALPLLPRHSAGEIILVLDNSYSMHAGTPSSRDKALRKLDSLLNEYSGRKFRVILAGTIPRNMGVFKEPAKVREILKNWQCREPETSLKEAIALGKKLGGKNTNIFLITDSLPESGTLPENFEWLAFGKKLPNVAIVNAVRAFDGSDRCLVIVANISDSPTKTVVNLNLSGRDKKISRRVTLDANEMKKLNFELPRGSGAVEISLSPDSLDLDNKVTLLRERYFALKAKILMKNRKSAELVKKALLATGRVSLVATEPHLLITDNPGEKNNFCKVIINTTDKQGILAGPYTFDRRHPLVEGLVLKGVLWGYGQTTRMDGSPLIMCGKNVLFSANQISHGNYNIYLNLKLANSTIQDTPNWPVLFLNLIDWNIARMPGVKRKNYRLGEKINFKIPGQTTNVKIQEPDGKTFDIRTTDKILNYNLEQTGKYSFSGKDFNYDVFVNPLNYGESDLRKLGSGEFEGQKTDLVLRENYINISWIFLLTAVGLLTLDWFLIRRAE
jgi:hypothetical protein